jgi:hypothetical protein
VGGSGPIPEVLMATSRKVRARPRTSHRPVVGSHSDRQSKRLLRGYVQDGG